MEMFCLSCIEAIFYARRGSSPRPYSAVNETLSVQFCIHCRIILGLITVSTTSFFPGKHANLNYWGDNAIFKKLEKIQSWADFGLNWQKYGKHKRNNNRYNIYYHLRVSKRFHFLFQPLLWQLGPGQLSTNGRPEKDSGEWPKQSKFIGVVKTRGGTSLGSG